MLETMLINTCKVLGFIAIAFIIMIVSALLHEYVFKEHKNDNSRD